MTPWITKPVPFNIGQGAAGAGSTPFDDTGLKCYWKYDGSSGDIENKSESSVDLGSGADLQTDGVTYDESGIIDYAISFNGTDSKATAGTSTSQFNFCHVTDHEWTLNFWLYANNQSGGKNILGTNAISVGTSTGFQVGASTNNRLFISLCDGTASPRPINDNYSSNNFIGSNTWQMFTITFSDPEEEAIVYRDFDEATYTINYETPSRTTGDASYPLKQGENAGSSDNNLAGRIDECSMFDRILEQSEIEALFNSGLAKAIYG